MILCFAWLLLGYFNQPLSSEDKKQGRGKIRERIDIVWCNELWQVNLRMHWYIIPRTHSDHHPVLIYYSPHIPKPTSSWLLFIDAWL